MIEQTTIRLWVTTDGRSQYFSARFPAKAHDLASNWLDTILDEVVDEEKLLDNIVKVTWMVCHKDGTPSMLQPLHCQQPGGGSSAGDAPGHAPRSSKAPTPQISESEGDHPPIPESV